MNTSNFATSLSYRIFLLLGIFLCACSCVDDLLLLEQEEEAQFVYLRLFMRQSSGSDTRANPTGGENGDGREHAIARENAIHDINLFIYTLKGGNGLNASDPSSIAIKKHIHLTDGSSNGFNRKDTLTDGILVTSVFDEVIPISDYTPSEDDWIIVVANAVGLSDVKNLGDLKDKIPVRSWSEISGVPSDFTMATARTVGDSWSEDGKVIINGKKGTKEDPFEVETTVERIAARIDFWYDATCVRTVGDNKVFEYSVTSGSGAKVQITNIIPVNLPQNPSYLFKHVTKDKSADDFGDVKDDDIVVCADETPVSGMPGNYVLEPTTLLDPKNKSFKEFSATQHIRTYNISFFSSANSVNSILGNLETMKYEKSGFPFDTYTILGYSDENTFIGTKYFKPEYLTGLTFKAYYIPGKIYASADLSQEITPVAGTSFWRFSPSLVFDDDGNKVDNIDESYSKYFSNKEAALEYDSLHPEYNGIITYYENGICYYTLWLKHSNYENGSAADPEYLFKMQYGIVRNNIYRVGVSFSGPGDDTPVLNGPVNMRPRIFVRKWNVREEDEIIF